MNREQPPSWILILFPTVFLAIITFGYLRPTRDLVRLQATVAEFSLSENGALQLNSLRARGGELSQEMSEMEGRRTALITRWTSLRERMSRSAERSNVLDAITQILLRNNLHVTEKGAAPNDHSAADDPVRRLEQRLHQPLTATFPEIREVLATADDAQPQAPNEEEATAHRRTVWSISCIGSYTDAQRAFAAIVAENDCIMPHGIEMEPAKNDSPLRRWKLVLSF